MRKNVLPLSVLAICFSAASGDIFCRLLPEIGGQEIVLEDSTKLTIHGYEASIKYVSNAEMSRQTVKILAASEEPSVVLQDGVLTIEPATCSVIDSNVPASSPKDASSAFASFVAPSILTSLVFMASPRHLESSILTAAFLTLMNTALGAELDDCKPIVELEISVPYDCPYNNFVDGKCLSSRMIADMLVQALFVDFDVDATERLLANDYIQHNPTVPTGAAPVLGFIPALEDSGLAIEVHRTLEEGNMVAFHSTYTNATLFGGETLIGFDVFRVENGKVQEHWDNLQELAGPNPSGHTMIDGPTMVKYLQETETSKEVAMGLVENVLVGGNASAAPLFISPVDYTQHNPEIADGLDGLGMALQTLAENGLSFSYDSIELVVAQGNFVLLGSPGEFGEGNPTAYYDLFRVEDGFIVEHWDVIQSIPPPSEFAHSNGKF